MLPSRVVYGIKAAVRCCGIVGWSGCAHPLAVLLEALPEQARALLLRQLRVVARRLPGRLGREALALQLLLQREVLRACGREGLACKSHNTNRASRSCRALT